MVALMAHPTGLSPEAPCLKSRPAPPASQRVRLLCRTLAVS